MKIKLTLEDLLASVRIEEIIRILSQIEKKYDALDEYLIYGVVTMFKLLENQGHVTFFAGDQLIIENVEDNKIVVCTGRRMVNRSIHVRVSRNGVAIQVVQFSETEVFADEQDLNILNATSEGPQSAAVKQMILSFSPKLYTCMEKRIADKVCDFFS